MSHSRRRLSRWSATVVDMVLLGVGEGQVSGSRGAVRATARDEPLGGASGDRHDRQRRVRRTLGGKHAAVGYKKVRHGEGAPVTVHDAGVLVGAHPGPTYEVGV